MRASGPMHEIQPTGRGVLPLRALTGGGLEVPPRFSRAVGYAGDSRYVSFHLTARSVPVVEDGEFVQAGHYSPLAVWSRHLSVWPALAGVGVDWTGGDPLGGPEHHIVLDRSTRRLYAGLAADVREFLSEALQAGAPRAEALQRGPSRDRSGGHGEDAEFGWAALAALFDWLDARPQPCPSCLRVHAAGDFETGSDQAGSDQAGRHQAGRVGGEPASEHSRHDLTTPLCPSCREPFYGRPLLVLLAGLALRDEVPPAGGPPEGGLLA